MNRRIIAIACGTALLIAAAVLQQLLIRKGEFPFSPTTNFFGILTQMQQKRACTDVFGVLFIRFIPGIQQGHMAGTHQQIQLQIQMLQTGLVENRQLQPGVFGKSNAHGNGAVQTGDLLGFIP